VHALILREEPDYSISMLYAGGSKALRLPDLKLALYFCHQLTLQLAWMGEALSVFSTLANNRVVKIAHFQFQGGLMNN
jgi:hypothetical protein